MSKQAVLFPSKVIHAPVYQCVFYCITLELEENRMNLFTETSVVVNRQQGNI